MREKMIGGVLGAAMAVGAACGGEDAGAYDAMRRRLIVHPDGRMFMRDDGAPFFWLADTAWELFHRLRHDEAESYLATRAAQGFTVIQAVILAEFNGLNAPTPDGHRPLDDNNPETMNDGYFALVDRIVETAHANGLVMALLPTWGDKWHDGNTPLFNPENARIYGENLGRRYAADRWPAGGIVWVLGGDRHIENDRQRATVNAMAEGLRAGDGGRYLMTYHPRGGANSVDQITEPWIDFHMAQTGHGRNSENFKVIRHMRDKVPGKPCLDGEPGYEDHPSGFARGEQGWLNDYDARRAAWWAVMAGAAGHTYGCHAIWQFWDPARNTPHNFPLKPWRASMTLPGAEQMRHVRRAVTSRRYFARHPLPEAVVDEKRRGGFQAVIASGDDETFMLAYFSHAEKTRLRTGGLEGRRVQLGWLDPRTGDTLDRAVIDALPGERDFAPPLRHGHLDWVLTLDVTP